MNATGWTMAEVRAMRIGDWRRLTSYWDRHPPTCELLELSVGWKASPAARQMTEEDAVALQKFVGGA